MDSIYKKVKNNTATEFERDALARYYEVTSLKEKEAELVSATPVPKKRGRKPKNSI